MRNPGHKAEGDRGVKSLQAGERSTAIGPTQGFFFLRETIKRPWVIPQKQENDLLRKKASFSPTKQTHRR